MTQIVLLFVACIMPFVACGQTIAEKMAQVLHLQNEISELDSQLLKCRQDRKKWTVATVAGGVGTVATGVGIGIQANKLKKLKKSGAVEQDSESSGEK